MRYALIAALALATTGSEAGSLQVTPIQLTDWKPVFGRVETKDLVPARSRISGTVIDLRVSEGDIVKQGETIAVVRDDKLAFQVAAVAAQLAALKSQLDRAQAELARGQALVNKGVVTAQRIEQLRTDVEVVRNQIASTDAQKSTVEQQQAEGQVLAPLSGRVLTTPITRGGVIMSGEVVATIAGGGFFLRLAVPERHAENLTEGAPIKVTTPDGETMGRLAKVYPQIENGKVVADVDVPGLETRFVDARVLVELPVGERSALVVPADAVTNRFGIDFVTVKSSEGDSERAVILGEKVERDSKTMVEVLSGLSAGDEVMTP